MDRETSGISEIRRLILVIVFLLGYLIGITIVHLVNLQHNPVREYVSNYRNYELGWIISFAVVLKLGAFAIVLREFHRCGFGNRFLWSIAIITLISGLVAPLFPIDETGHRTVIGVTHNLGVFITWTLGTFLILRLTMEYPNHPGWENPEYIQLLDDSMQCLDSTKRFELLERAERIFIDEQPITSLFHWNYAYLQKPYLKGVHISPIGSVHLGNAYFDQEELN